MEVFNIVNLKSVKMGGEFLINYQYNIDKPDPKLTKRNKKAIEKVEKVTNILPKSQVRKYFEHILYLTQSSTNSSMPTKIPIPGFDSTILCSISG